MVLNEIIKQSDLERHFHLSKSTVSGLVKRLTNNGFIEKADVHHHYAISLTEKAKLTINNFKKANEETRDKLLNGFSEEQKEEMIKSLKHMIANMEAQKDVE